jgi:hypothetical protein
MHLSFGILTLACLQSVWAGAHISAAVPSNRPTNPLENLDADEQDDLDIGSAYNNSISIHVPGGNNGDTHEDESNVDALVGQDGQLITVANWKLDVSHSSSHAGSTTSVLTNTVALLDTHTSDEDDEVLPPALSDGLVTHSVGLSVSNLVADEPVLDASHHPSDPATSESTNDSRIRPHDDSQPR